MQDQAYRRDNRSAGRVRMNMIKAMNIKRGMMIMIMVLWQNQYNKGNPPTLRLGGSIGV